MTADWRQETGHKIQTGRLRVKYTCLHSTNTYEMSLTIEMPIKSFACRLCCMFPLTIYTSPFLRISFAPVLVLIFRRLSPPEPITKPLYSAAISTISPGGGAVGLPLCISCCRGEKKPHFQIVILAKQLHVLVLSSAMVFTPSMRSKQV